MTQKTKAQTPQAARPGQSSPKAIVVRSVPFRIGGEL